jgi:hypothetical protein
VDEFVETNHFLDGDDRYETVLVAVVGNPPRALNGIRMMVDLTFEEATGRFDI